jgi:hypothetical protein
MSKLFSEGANTCRWLLASIIMLSAPVTAGLAQIGEPQSIAQAVPDPWREPFAQFLRDLGVRDVASIMANTKFARLGGAHRPESVLFRIEDKSACDDDVCLTVIGHPSGGRFLADALFAAGAKSTWFDHTVEFLGLQAVPYVFESRKGRITLFETSAGWIVIPQTR